MKIEKITRDKLFKLKDKYIFHGSSKLFDKAKPHQAKCDTKNPLNEQVAVYGAKDLRFAIIFAFEKLPKTNFSWAAINYDGQYVAELKNGTYIDENAKGYLYCFNKTKFKETQKGSNQYVCYEEIEPEIVFEIAYVDYKDFFINIEKAQERKC